MPVLKHLVTSADDVKPERETICATCQAPFADFASMEDGMSRTNVLIKPKLYTHEGGPAPQLSAEVQLRRCVLSCLLWENEFYEDGQSIADRVVKLAGQVPVDVLATIAIEARERYHLRHIPLLLLVVLIRRYHSFDHYNVYFAITRIIQRADEPGELLALFWKDGRKMLPRQMRLGLGDALRKFKEYHFAKYNRASAKVKLRDVFRMVRPRPDNKWQAELWRKVVKNELTPPDTWESALVAGKDKRDTFERLLCEGKLGYLALFRNLRNMDEVGVSPELIESAILKREGASKVLPFRYVAAAKAAPRFAKALDEALLASINELPTLSGNTLILVDVSSSMSAPLSGKSDMRRIDAAAALASIIRCERVRLFRFAHFINETQHFYGLTGVYSIVNQYGGNTYLGKAIDHINDRFGSDLDRLIVITDEQTQDRVPSPKAKLSYLINVGSYQNGIGYDKDWTRINGFSEGVIHFIHENELLLKHGYL